MFFAATDSLKASFVKLNLKRGQGPGAVSFSPRKPATEQTSPPNPSASTHATYQKSPAPPGWRRAWPSARSPGCGRAHGVAWRVACLVVALHAEVKAATRPQVHGGPRHGDDGRAEPLLEQFNVGPQCEHALTRDGKDLRDDEVGGHGGSFWGDGLSVWQGVF